MKKQEQRQGRIEGKTAHPGRVDSDIFERALGCGHELAAGVGRGAPGRVHCCLAYSKEESDVTTWQQEGLLHTLTRTSEGAVDKCLLELSG